jgi:hypothetical protein
MLTLLVINISKKKKERKGFMLRKSADLRVIAPTNSSK